MAGFFQIFNLDFVPPSPLLTKPKPKSKHEHEQISSHVAEKQRLPFLQKTRKPQRQQTLNPAAAVLYLFDLDIVPPSPLLAPAEGQDDKKRVIQIGSKRADPESAGGVAVEPATGAAVDAANGKVEGAEEAPMSIAVAAENALEKHSQCLKGNESVRDACHQEVEKGQNGHIPLEEEEEEEEAEAESKGEELKSVLEKVGGEEEGVRSTGLRNEEDALKSPEVSEPEGEKEEQKSEPASSTHSQDDLLSPPVPRTPLPTVYRGRNGIQPPSASDKIPVFANARAQPKKPEFGQTVKAESGEVGQVAAAAFVPNLDHSDWDGRLGRKVGLLVVVSGICLAIWSGSVLPLLGSLCLAAVFNPASTHYVARVAWFYVTMVLSRVVKLVHRPSSTVLKNVSRRTYAGLESIDPPTYMKVKVQTVQNDVAKSITLFSTLYLPDTDTENGEGEGAEKFPCVIIRTPYGREFLGKDTARALAERGYACLLQDTRGRFGSGGDFFPVKDEINDGGETVEWVAAQPWCSGKVGLYGVSYLGFTAYAAAGSRHGVHVAAMMPVASCASTHSVLYHNGDGGPFALELTLKWLWLAVKLMNATWYAPIKFFIPWLHGEVNRSLTSMPLCEQDKILIGKELAFYQEAIRHTSSDHEFWNDKNILCDLKAKPELPNHIIGGWYDFFLKQSFKDFLAQNESGESSAAITIFERHHWNILSAPVHSLCFNWFDQHLKDPTKKEKKLDSYRIQVSVVSAKQLFLGFNQWPPAEAADTEYFLHCDGRMSRAKPTEKGSFTSHIYDPLNPTPSVGGPSFDFTNVGRKEQKKLEERPDVVTFTSDVLPTDTYVVGNVKVRVHVDSSNPNTDFFFKVCDVYPNGKSYNVCEHIKRLYPSAWNGTVNKNTVRMELEEVVSPIAVCFKKGHRIRLQVSGGAHPLYMRNLGVEEAFHTAKTTLKAVHKIHHSLDLSSYLSLPVLDEPELLKHAIRPVDV